MRAVESLRAEEEKAMYENELLVEELGENLDKRSVSSLQYVGTEPEQLVDAPPEIMEELVIEQ